jgi:hypothetical protein
MDAPFAPKLRKSDYQRLAALRFQLRRLLRFSELEAQAVGCTSPEKTDTRF